MNFGNFIWIENSNVQKCRKNIFDQSIEANFGVYTFKRHYQYGKNIDTIKMDIFADTNYFLYINNKFIGSGPVCPGGDYNNTQPMPIQYYDTYEIPVNSQNVDILVMVQLDVIMQAEMSLGNGGLIVSGTAILSDGTQTEISTDENWLVCKNSRFPSVFNYDYTKKDDEWNNAVIVPSIWNLKKSQIPLLKRSRINTDFSPVVIPGHSKQDIVVETDKIYSANLEIDITASGDYEIDVFCCEVAEKASCCEKITGNISVKHRSIVMASVSVCKLHIKNLSDTPLTISDVILTYVRYPEDGNNGRFSCSDAELNKIYELGRHTLEICRQSIHLDSPLHQENMGCSGDYFIESLIEYYAYSDTRLTRFDIIRIADYLKMSEGYMFHTTYSLIWIEMVYEYYMHTDDIETLSYAFEGIKCVLDKMKSYSDESGIIQNPPSYMFIDWTWIGEHNLHHPPKAMGQAVLNAFYYNGLIISSKLASFLSDISFAERLSKNAALLKTSFNNTFFDNEKGLYFDGLNDETKNVSQFMPENVNGRYFSKYTNTLAALYGLCDKEKGAEILEKALYNSNLGDVQIYFMHFVLEALYKCGLFKKYGISEIKRWTALVEECPKGLKEAWIIFEGYGFDYSHAWGATPSYQLPSKISGLEIIEPGMKKIKLSPELFGLKNADINIPTPYGNIIIVLKENEAPLINAPKEITVIY